MKIKELVYRFLHKKEIRHREEQLEAYLEAWERVKEHSKKLCEEAEHDSETYGKKKLFIQIADGVTYPIPVEKGKEWKIEHYALREGTILPHIRMVDEGEGGVDYTIKQL